MKRITSLLAVALMAMLTLSLVSCDDDPYIADSLAGTWNGKMYVSSVYDGYTYDATYSELYFDKDPYSYSSGGGYWVDHYVGDAHRMSISPTIQVGRLETVGFAFI